MDEVAYNSHNIGVGEFTFIGPTNLHRHHDVQLIALEGGEAAYLFGGRKVRQPEEQVSVFWASIPHRVLGCSPNTKIHWVTIPLGQFLSWHIPGPLTEMLLNGNFLVDTLCGCTHANHKAFARWMHDVQTSSEESVRVLLLEVEACLRRLASSISTDECGQAVAGNSEGTFIFNRRAVDGMIRFISDHYTEPIGLRDIADSASVHPHYASRLFGRSVGIGPVSYLIQYRIAHSQRLLVTTDLPVLDVALSSGFGSISQFYAAFKQACSCTPAAYRRRLAGSGP